MVSAQKKADLAELLRMYGDEEHPHHEEYSLTHPVYAYGNPVSGNLNGMLQTLCVSVAALLEEKEQ